jgi:manganese-dependent inorganic pyrophosphatase
MSNVYIIGHRNPDTDSICSAMAYAALRNSLENQDRFIPVRIGDVAAETKFVLDYFGIEPPIYMENVKAQVKDLNINKVPTVGPEYSLKNTWNIMKEHGITTLCVSKEIGVVDGIITMVIWLNLI